MIYIAKNRQVSYYTVEDYCKRLANKVYNLLCLKEENEDIVKAIDKLSEELRGATISGVSPFIDNSNVLEILFLISGLKDECNFNIYRTIILDCCSLINKLPDRINDNL